MIKKWAFLTLLSDYWYYFIDFITKYQISSNMLNHQKVNFLFLQAPVWWLAFRLISPLLYLYLHLLRTPLFFDGLSMLSLLILLVNHWFFKFFKFTFVNEFCWDNKLMKLTRNIWIVENQDKLILWDTDRQNRQ